MNVLVITESYFGNTSRVAEAIATGLRSRNATVTVAAVASGPALDGVDLLILGSATHNMGLPSPASRRQARDKGSQAPATGVAEWLEALPGDLGCRVAAFDTVTGTGFFSGSAAKAIEKRLRRRSVSVITRKSFLVTSTQGPLADGEVDRAEQWGASLA
ncbi:MULTISPECIES: flavodoxin family protein [Streptomyces]|uniref:Flavodoxin family protein n=1 Tax=Streptomyces kasugaensis TaxID=1946 RepID=A0A4Q9HRN7_STRKA|nr:flavodoxin domain-containing protein [Streptomyces kasugaensis]TBO57644.1 flavodoxin family protein [Streptomyces kasugaensis]